MYGMVFLIIIEYCGLDQKLYDISFIIIKNPQQFQFTLIIFLENLHGLKN